MSEANETNISTRFENRRTHINSMHQIDEERVSGCRPEQQQHRTRPLTDTRFPPSPRRYEPHEFGLDEDEQFQHPRVFENLSYQTDAAAFEAMRAQNARPRYQQQPQFNICDLPSEQLEDFSDPQLSESECNVYSQQQQQQMQQKQTPNISDISAPNFCDISDASPWPQRTPTQLRQPQQGQPSYPDECLDDESAPMHESPEGTPTTTFHYTPIELMNTPDVCVPTPSVPTSIQTPHYSPIKFQSSPVRYPSECLENVTVPSFPDSPCDLPTPASPPRVQTPQDLPSNMLHDISPPSYRSPPSPSLSYPNERLDELTMPSFENVSCGSPLDRRFLLDSRLADESPPSFVSSGPPTSRRLSPNRGTPYQRSIVPPSQVSPKRRSPDSLYTPKRKDLSPCRRFNLAQFMPQRTPISTSAISPSPCTPTPEAPHVSLYSPTPIGGRPMPTDLPSECLTDISEPAYFNRSPHVSPRMPQNLPSECLGDISEPSFAMTPPARTPSLPHDLPFENIWEKSPRSEHLSCMSMPSFADTSCGSPLDRRFLLDPRLAEESPPTFVSSISSPSRCPSSYRTSSSSPQRASLYIHTPIRRSRSAPLQRSLSPLRRQISRASSPVCPPTPVAPHFSLRSPTPIRLPPRRPIATYIPDECLMDISEPAYFNSPPRASPERIQFPSNMTSECLADVSAPVYELTPPPRTPSMPHNLPSDMIFDVSPPMYRSPPSEHLSGESMPSFANTSCGSPLDRRFLLDPYLGDESIPSMISSRSPRGNQTPGEEDAASFDKTYCEILQRFNALKSKVNTPQTAYSGTYGTGDGGPQLGECIRETVVERTENENGQLESTTQHIVVMRDPGGSLKTHTKEVKTQFPQSSPQRLYPPSADSGVLTQSPRPAEHVDSLRSSIRRRLSFNLTNLPDENLADVSLPCDDELPSMDPENMLQRLSSVPQEQIINVSAPSYRTPPTPSISYPSEMLESVLMPSFENASCGSPLDRRFLLDPKLVDESPPSFVSSYGDCTPASHDIYSPQRSPIWQTQYMQGRTPTPTPSRFDQNSVKPTMGSIKQGDPQYLRRFSLRSPSSRGKPADTPMPVTPPASHFSLHSPTPVGLPARRPFPSNLTSEQLMDISEPAYFNRASGQRRYLPSGLPSERLDDISQPSYQRTPPPQTPGFPSSLPSEMLGNVSAPSYRSPASEHISNVSMPSFEDVSYESPLDRRFLLDPRLADESMPSFPGTPTTPYTGDKPRPGVTRRRLSYSQPDSSRGSDARTGQFRSSSEGRGDRGRPTRVEQTHTTIQQSGAYQQEHSVTPANESSSTDQHRGLEHSALLNSAKEQLKIATSIHSITRTHLEDTGGSLSDGKQNMQIPSENILNVSTPYEPPSMTMPSTRRSQRHDITNAGNLEDISIPSVPPSMETSTSGRSQQRRRRSAREDFENMRRPSSRTRRQRTIEDVNDISPISFASTISSRGSTSRRGSANNKYRSTYSRGFSGLANYAPFFEQIRSRSNSEACDPYDPCSPCCPTVQNVDSCDPCANLHSSNRIRKNG